ncbi:hypothetical protein NS226_07965 [Aureimonas ureilytica]|uniref:Uncharacterized protein n=2 Tax=Aureimonas ureilytica TaxID=401562 RepID=A0A175R9J5_9HYPH|nr:hypothetical protein NS226_07965 [Aureimonas ureilytica]
MMWQGLMMALVAFLLLLIAYIFQMVGYTGTCTQGADGPFLTGVTLSFPFLVASIGSLAMVRRRLVRNRRPRGSAFTGVMSAMVCLMALWMLAANRQVAYDTLWLGIGPCGSDYHFEGEPLFLFRTVLVGVIYAIMPAFVSGFALLNLWNALPDVWNEGVN